MQLFFEEDGNFKAGTVLKKDGNAYQVELPTGKRTKVKGGHVFFEFDGVSAQDFMSQAQSLASEIDPAFLWEVAGLEEFSFESLASEYYGVPSVQDRAATLLALHANPVYFYRKGRGQYRAAPEEILKRALEAVARREQQEQRRREMAAEMVEGKLPDEIARAALSLLIKPDKNSIEWKALNDASSSTRLTPLRLLLKLGAIASPYRWHVDGFYFEHFPQGKGFPRNLPDPIPYTGELATSNVKAFSIDDSNTTEIDDAVSVTELPDGKLRVGIHISAPSLMLLRDSPVDNVARERMSTVYGPGIKTTMLPETWIKEASLDEGKTVPCVSLYVTLDAQTYSILTTETRVEKVFIEANLRYDTFDSEVTEKAIIENTLSIPYAREISLLWHFAKVRQADREAYRGRPEQPGRVEWYFVLDGEDENAKIELRSRQRGAPIDLVVSELMIFANMTWGLWLEECGVCGIYRSQRMGRVKMSTIPGPHDGLGVERYAWSTSPLRRYVDMVNQRQLISAAMGVSPVYMSNDADLFTCVSAFEVTYDAYNEFQGKMERYWSLRWIEQEGLKEIVALVVKEDLVRIEGLPFMQRIPGLPLLERGRKIRLRILSCDFVDIVLETQLIEVLDDAGVVDESDEEVPEEQQTADTAQEPHVNQNEVRETA